MIQAAQIAGTVTGISQLNAAIVQHGQKPNLASLYLTYTPWWIRTSHGRYRFIFSDNQVKEYFSSLTHQGERI